MYEFSFGSLFLGLAIMAFGGCLVLFYRQIADNLASGVSSYQNVKLFGLITLAVGFIIATSLHTLFLNLIISLFFRRT